MRCDDNQELNSRGFVFDGRAEFVSCCEKSQVGFASAGTIFHARE